MRIQTSYKFEDQLLQVILTKATCGFGFETNLVADHNSMATETC
jgi:hypothetical protein